MAFKVIEASVQPSRNLYHEVKKAVEQQKLSAMVGNESFEQFKQTLGQITGVESADFTSKMAGVTANTFSALAGSMGRSVTPAGEYEVLKDAAVVLAAVQGLEGFSLQNFAGDETAIKAANMTLNAQSHLQTAAAEALFSTITVRYEDEGVTLKVRAAGIGNYAYGNSAWQSASELTPIFGQLRTGAMFKEEVLKLHPVYPEAADADTRRLFAPAALIAPSTANYPEADAYGRDSHLTQYLAVPCNIPNLLGLTEVPGQRPWTSTDEIESNSITAESIALTGKLGATDVSFFIDTKSISNNAFGPNGQIQTSDERSLNLSIRNHPGFAVLDKDGLPIGETLFAEYKTAGYEPMLTTRLTGQFNRMTNELNLSSGSVEISALREITTGNLIKFGKATAPQKVLLQKLTGSLSAVLASFNATNISRGNFGYRIEVFDSIKHLAVRRGTPLSVKYPISKEDVNQDSLDFAIQQMSVAINNQCSKKAFDAAQDHLKYITSIDGAPVVSNQQGSNVLPGQHFVTASAVNREMKLADSVSSLDSQGVFDNVSAAMLNEISDILAALNTKSGLAAIAEYGGVGEIEWSVIVHQNLSRFVMRSGDARTFGPKLPIKVIETNFDSQIGQILIVPRNTSSNESINPLGGIGVNVSKENILVQGNVTRDQQDFGVVMTMPTYRHWPLNPIIGSLTILDAHEFLGDAGLLTKLAKQKVVVEGLTAGIEDLVTATEGNVPNP